MELDRSKIELFCKIREEVIFLLGEYKVHDRELAECIAVGVAALFPAWAKERGMVELAEDQSLPPIILTMSSSGQTHMQKKMLQAGWRKVKP